MKSCLPSTVCVDIGEDALPTEAVLIGRSPLALAGDNCWSCNCCWTKLCAASRSLGLARGKSTPPMPPAVFGLAGSEKGEVEAVAEEAAAACATAAACKVNSAACWAIDVGRNGDAGSMDTVNGGELGATPGT